jgi:hypothetical protein
MRRKRRRRKLVAQKVMPRRDCMVVRSKVRSSIQVEVP